MRRGDVPKIEPEDIASLSREVEKWFRELNTKFNPPSPSGCSTIAFYILATGSRPRALRQQSTTIKNAKALLRRLEGEEKSVTRSIDLALSGTANRRWLKQIQKFQTKVRKAQAAVQELLPLLSPPSDPELDPIRRLAAIVREAFEETNEGRSPKSNKPDQLICRFLVWALKGRQHGLKASGISEILKGRRRA